MQYERYRLRDRHFGAWHRSASMSRFLPARVAASMTMIDVDSILYTEYDRRTQMPLCLIEAARDVGQATKPAGVIVQLAKRARIPAYVALYTPANDPCPGSTGWWPDIAAFRIRRIWPSPEADWRVMAPNQWAEALVKIRDLQLAKYNGMEAANDPAF